MSDYPIKTCEYCGAKGIMPTFQDQETVCYSCLKSFPSTTRDIHHEIYDLRTALAKLLEAYDALLPGARRIPVDIGLLNDAAMLARPLVEKHK